ncbi:MAG: succinylglutamate desuccinylase/aspartoacylase family protein [Deltaproteobacteria bacterium]|nr:succinylglutamate desuccinylase/aspartoacylase family protein [Deltaproteobacteria bacterium]
MIRPALTHLAVPGTSARIPLLTLDTGRPGPRACVTAGIHGDEPVGVATAHALVPLLAEALVTGSVRIFPALCSDALLARTRVAPGEPVDLNRVFPGDPRGGLNERVARIVWEEIVAFQPDLVVDVHADSTLSIPYTLLDRPLGPQRARTRALSNLAKSTGLTVLWDYPEDRYRAWHFDQSLTGALVNRVNLLALTVETGPRQVVSPTSVDTAVGAVLGILTHAGLLDRPAPNHASRVPGGPWRRESGPPAGHRGILVPRVEAGRVVEARAVLGELRAPSGESLEILRAPAPCFVLAWADRGVMDVGEPACTLGVPDR